MSAGNTTSIDLEQPAINAVTSATTTNRLPFVRDVTSARAKNGRRRLRHDDVRKGTRRSACSTRSLTATGPGLFAEALVESAR
jgi:hypothetical protein